MPRSHVPHAKVAEPWSSPERASCAKGAEANQKALSLIHAAQRRTAIKTELE